MLPWWIVVAGAWFAVAFLLAPLIGRFFGLTNDETQAAPPAHPRARLVLDRDRAGHVEIKPTVRRGA